MRHCLTVLALAVLLLMPPQPARADIHITIGDSAFYGLLDMAGFSNPRFVYPDPLIINRTRALMGEPLYLRVPPGHLKKWDKHCREYNACNHPVYFVDDNWYRNTYAPQYRKRRSSPWNDDRSWRDDDHYRRDNNRYWRDNDDDDDDRREWRRKEEERYRKWVSDTGGQQKWKKGNEGAQRDRWKEHGRGHGKRNDD